MAKIPDANPGTRQGPSNQRNPNPPGSEKVKRTWAYFPPKTVNVKIRIGNTTKTVQRKMAGSWAVKGSAKYKGLVGGRYANGSAGPARTPTRMVYTKYHPGDGGNFKLAVERAHSGYYNDQAGGKNHGSGKMPPGRNPGGSNGVGGGPKGPNNGNPKTPKGGGGGGGGGGNTAVNYKQFQKLIGKANVGQMVNPGKMAAAEAGQQFDPGINATQTQQAEGKAQAAQNLADITNWYQQIQGANTAAQTANNKQASISEQAAQAATQSALAAIGGSANASAGSVAAAGTNQQAGINLLNQAQNNYENNLGPALQNAQAGQMSAQTALDSQANQALQQQLVSLLGQKGQAQTADKLALIQQNNELAQSRFGDRIAKLQGALGAAQSLGNIKMTGAQTAAVNKANHGGANPNAGQNKWGNLNSNQKYQLVSQWVFSNGKNADGTMTPVRENHAIQIARSLGYTGPHVLALIHTFYQ